MKIQKILDILGKRKVLAILLTLGSTPLIAYGAVNCFAATQDNGACGTPTAIISPQGYCYVIGNCSDSTQCVVQEGGNAPLLDCQDATFTATAPVAVYSPYPSCTQLVKVFNDSCYGGGTCYQITSTTPCS
jgi:hypothetical protein